MTEQDQPAYSGPELCALDAVRVVDMMRRREVSPRDLIEAAAQRHAATDPVVNAMPTTCFDRAYDAAAALDGAARRENPAFLHGLPLGIKDLMAVAGVRFTSGTPGRAAFVPEESDPLVLRLEENGGLVVGKTNTPEFGAGGNTFNAVFGHTRNPWDARLSPAGSSGGAAAQLVVGQTWLSHGSDHGGSLRTPAAWCGVVGLRPSPGLVAGGPREARFIIEGTQGPMARTVRDCALFLDALTGFEPLHPISFPPPSGTSYLQAAECAEPTLNIGWTPDLGGNCPVDREVADHLGAVMATLDREGAVIEEIAPALPDMHRTYYTLRGILWATRMRDIDPAVRSQFKATLEDDVRRGMALGIDDIIDAQRGRTLIYDELRGLLERHDIIACPVVGCMPRPIETEWVREVGGTTFDFYLDWLSFAFPATIAGLPAISVPVGRGPRGLPVGLQLIGQPRGEAALLAAARAVEIAVGGPLPVIDPVAH